MGGPEEGPAVAPGGLMNGDYAAPSSLGRDPHPKVSVKLRPHRPSSLGKEGRLLIPMPYDGAVGVGGTLRPVEERVAVLDEERVEVLDWEACSAREAEVEGAWEVEGDASLDQGSEAGPRGGHGWSRRAPSCAGNSKDPPPQQDQASAGLALELGNESFRRVVRPMRRLQSYTPAVRRVKRLHRAVWSGSCEGRSGCRLGCS